MKRSRLAVMVGVAAVLAGCGAPQAVSETVVRPEAAQAADNTIDNCEQDGLPVVASIDPKGMTTAASSWPDGSTMAAIKKKGKLVVGVAGDVTLWGSRDPMTSKLGGFDIDVAKRVAQELGLDPNRDVEYKVINFAQRLPKLQAHEVDLVAHTMTITCDRWFNVKSHINFSSEYYRAGQKLLVRSDSEATKVEDLKNEKVCTTKGSTSLDTIRGKVDDVVEVDAVGECLVKFQEGEVAAITSDDTVLAGFAQQDPYAKVMAGDALTIVPYGLGTAPDAADFTQFVNVVLEKMRGDGTFDRLYSKWMGSDGGTRPDVPRAVYGRTADELEQERS
ncbi:glutamate ABC transporter substrate-binding protein [Kineosporia succinea]|uniref:Polar amino acid transport system substrate-binding protein n=1 Tax=Kineosporia succinea TaxID=84632 RepID=A0ABT9P3Z8_9ACTN|nr:glutamate ABC transporter substrate-binding protein [Kineosporia succinea]MDP9827281.1 polar amino acid transport system substrate-binding protein [Kineosporia succinea]